MPFPLVFLSISFWLIVDSKFHSKHRHPTEWNLKNQAVKLLPSNYRKRQCFHRRLTPNEGSCQVSTLHRCCKNQTLTNESVRKLYQKSGKFVCQKCVCRAIFSHLISLFP